MSVFTAGNHHCKPHLTDVIAMKIGMQLQLVMEMLSCGPPPESDNYIYKYIYCQIQKFHPRGRNCGVGKRTRFLKK